jgi:hypothetical protein
MDTLADAVERTRVSKLQFCNAAQTGWKMTKLSSTIHAAFISIWFNGEV